MTLRTIDTGVVAAPMAGGPSTPDLVAAVGEAGGLGFLAGGYLDLRAARGTGRRRLGPLLPPLRRQPLRPRHRQQVMPCGPAGSRARPAPLPSSAYREALLDDAAALGTEPGQPPTGGHRRLGAQARPRRARARGRRLVHLRPALGRAVLGELRRAGIETVVTVTDVDEARAALEAGVDGLCVQGAEAGGHRGTLDPTAVPDGGDLVDLVQRVRGSRPRRAVPTSRSSLRAASPPASGPRPCERPAPMPCRSARHCSSPRRRAPDWPIDAPWATRHTRARR